MENQQEIEFKNFALQNGLHTPRHTIDLADAGLVHLNGVRTTNLSNTKITGLVYLKGVHTIPIDTLYIADTHTHA